MIQSLSRRRHFRPNWSVVIGNPHSADGRFYGAGILVIVAWATVFLCQVPVVAQDTAALPLHQQLDQLLVPTTTGPVAAACTDAEFLRRVTLDVVGDIPTASQVREFLADQNPQKRRQLVDRLLEDPRHSLHMAEVFDAILMERRPARQVPHAEWLTWLQGCFRENLSWNRLVEKLVTSDGTDPATRAAARFFLDREAEPHTMTRDIGRIFFGVDLQCAQCHDHPLVDHYAQSDYYGLYAFVNRTVMVKDEPSKQMQLGEKADGQADFQSVFTQDASRSRPRFPGGPELDEPHFPLGEEYVVAPADKVRPVARHSRRALLALATDGRNDAFNRNLPNRLWSYLFGRGLVHPVDWHHPHNPPTHPAVLDAMTRHFVASGFDIRALLKELLLTQAYQRSIDLPGQLTLRSAEAESRLRELAKQVSSLEAELKPAALKQAELYAQKQAAGAALKTLDETWQKSVKDALALRKALNDSEAALSKAKDALQSRQLVTTAAESLLAKAKELESQLKQDAELTQAVALFEKRRTAINEELKPLRTAVEQQQVKRNAAHEKWRAAVAATETNRAAYIKASEPWEQRKQEWLAARLETLSKARLLESVRQQQRHWQHTADLAKTTSEVARLQNALASEQTAVAAAEKVKAGRQQDLTVGQQALATAQMSAAVARQQLETAQSEANEQAAAVKAVSEAEVATSVALQKFPADPELTKALESIQKRLEPLNEASKSLADMVAEKTSAINAASKQVQAEQVSVEKARLQCQQMEVQLAELSDRVQKTNSELIRQQAQLEKQRLEIRSIWEAEFAVRIEKPLSPEQLAQAMMTAVGSTEVHRGIADREIEKTIPLASVKEDSIKRADRQYRVEQLLRQRLRGNVNSFVATYAAGAGLLPDQFLASADQALFLGNGATMRNWLNPAGCQLLIKTLKLEKPADVANELYSAVLCRPPVDAEIGMITQHLAGREKDQSAAHQELLWALLTCAEFRFNY